MKTQQNLDSKKYDAMINTIRSRNQTELEKSEDIKNSVNTFIWLTGCGNVTLFQFAVIYGTPEAVNFLMRAGADLSDNSFTGYYPFLLLVSKVYQEHLCENLEILLKSKLNVEVIDINGRTPLHAAAGNGRGELVELFLKYGAKVNAQDKLGNSPLHLAAQSYSPYSAIPLMKNGANFFAENKAGYTPIGIAKKRDETEYASHCARGYGFFSRIEPLLLEGNVINLLLQGQLSKKLPIIIGELVSAFLPLETLKNLTSLTKKSRKEASKCLDFDYLEQKEFGRKPK